MLETYRECLQDVFDLPALRELLARHRAARDRAWSRSRRRTASPFAPSLLFDYIAQYMYEGDAPLAERRAQALALDRELLRELLGPDELRELLDPAALAEVEASCVPATAGGPGADGLHDLLRRVGDLTDGRGRPPSRRRRQPSWLARWRRRGARVRDRRRGAADRGRGRRRATATRSARCRRRACRDAFLEPVAARPARTSSPATPAPTGRSVADAGRAGWACRASGSLDELRALEADGARRRGASCGPAGSGASGATPRCCGASGAHRWRACAREVEAVPARDAGPLPAALAGRRRRRPRRRRRGCAR